VPLYFAKVSLAAFSFQILELDRSVFNSNTEEVNVKIKITDLPSNSFFKVAFQKSVGARYFGEVQDKNANWVDVSNSNCNIFYEVTDLETEDITLKLRVGNADGVENGNYNLVALRYTSSCAATKSNEMPVEINISPPSLTPTPTSTPKPTATAKPQAKVVVSEAKSGGDTLGSVKIYIDDQYIHHYAPEEIVFCDGCNCYDGVSCGFGSHKFGFEKSGYETFVKQLDVSERNTYNIDPLLSVLDEDETPSPTATSVSTSTPISPPGDDTKQEEIEDDVENQSDISQPLVLGIKDTFGVGEEKILDEQKKILPNPLGFLLSGFAFALLSVAVFLKAKTQSV